MSARVGTLAASPGALGLRRASRALPDLAESAGRSGLGCRGFPQAKTPSAEPGGRSERRRRRNYASAHLPPGVRPLAELGPSELESGIAASQVEQLASLDRFDARGNVVLAGPPGPGKAMAALGPGPRRWTRATPSRSRRWSPSSRCPTTPRWTGRPGSGCATCAGAGS